MSAPSSADDLASPTEDGTPPPSRAVEAQYRQILDGAIDTVIVSTDLDGRVLSWNAGATRVIGYTDEEMLGRPVDTFFTPEDRESGLIRAEMAEALASGFSEHEGWRMRRDGSRFWASGQMTPLRSEAGEITGFVKIVRNRTIERSAQDALAASQEQLRLAQSAGGIGTFAVDIAGGRLQLTPEFCRLFGVQPSDDLTPEDFEALVFEEDRSLVSGAHTRASGEAPSDVEYRIRRASDQSLRWIHRKAQFIRNPEGQPIQMVGVVQDITRRRRAEDALRRSEMQFRAFAQALPNQIWTAGPDGRIDWFNERLLDYVGIPTDELLGLDWSQFVHPEDLEATTRAWNAAWAARSPFEIEYRLRRRDGAFRWHLARAVPLDADDPASRWIGSNTDIEDQKAAMALLAASKETLQRQIAESTAERDRIWRLSTDVMIVADFDGVITGVNPAWSRALGWAADDAVGRKLMEFVHEEDVAATQQEVGKLAAGETTLRFENRYRCKDGSFRAFSWTAVPEAGFLHAVGRDVSAERKANRELQTAQEALRQAQKMEAVGQLTGGIAHDFNNLLTGIIGSLDMMQRRAEQGRPVDVMRYASTALTAANRAAALTHRLLAFSRRQPLDPRPIGANQLVRGMEDLLRRTIGESIRLEIVTAAGLWPTKCDAHQLENAILNLAINARDAMPNGGVMTIETCNTHLDAAYAETLGDVSKGQYVCICVTDTGVGMPPDVVEKAFEPFFTTKPLGEGTGLGLSMIYGFTRQSEGYARIYSELGKGTTVKLYLPRYHGAMAGPEAGALPAPAPSSLTHEVVLVVEDEVAVRGLVVDVLQELGYQAVEAPDGLEGLRLVQSDMAIDLLVTDIGLPGLNGRQLADAARAARPGLRVLFMTGYAENAALAGGFLEPGMEMITKPFAIEALAKRIRDMIDAP
ncbi:PAS domain S-box protein [Brevundimonas sp.]|jgi:PAS domain S-box-containing protein|uniref:PAS domain S-box protein n=1 Tax=Brevundimonas sp. TaxID=1871086 RepID=UPI0037BEEAB9